MEIVEELKSIQKEVDILRNRFAKVKLPVHSLIKMKSGVVDGALASASIQIKGILEYVEPIEKAKNFLPPSPWKERGTKGVR
jgi:hypothetical protein